MPARVVTFGEIMLRLSTPGFERFTQAGRFDATFGGGEANVAASLAQFGTDAFFVSKLPRSAIGQAALNHLRRFGVRTDYIARGGERLGIYFLETGASQRPSKVIYDRSHSAITTFDSGDVDWDVVLEDADWFHWTGITPALGAAPRRSLEEALAAARSSGTTVSCDLNYRAKLWGVEEAQASMRPLMRYVDVCIANEEDSEKSLGMRAPDSDVESGTIDEAGYAHLAKSLQSEFGFRAVAITLRESHSASRNEWSAMFLGGAGGVSPVHEPIRSRKYDVQIIDRVGAGDSFAAGLIYGLLERKTAQQALEFAVAASCLKHTVPGDFNVIAVEEVDALAKGTGSGRVVR